MPKVLVRYYSSYGHIETMAQAITNMAIRPRTSDTRFYLYGMMQDQYQLAAPAMSLVPESIYIFVEGNLSASDPAARVDNVGRNIG